MGLVKDKGQIIHHKRRSLICTIAAWSSGVFGFGIGGWLSASGQIQVCQTHPWGIEQLCSTWAAPGAFFRGGITGLWVGTILGAFAAGSATYLDQTAIIVSEEEKDVENQNKIPWSEIQAWIEAAALLEPQVSRSLTVEQSHQLLEQLGFSETTINQTKLPTQEIFANDFEIE